MSVFLNPELSQSNDWNRRDDLTRVPSNRGEAAKPEKGINTVRAQGPECSAADRAF